MALWMSFQVALRGLAANKLRAILTMLGIIIGVAAVIALLAVGQGAQAEITRQIQGIGSNLVVVIPGALQRGGGPAQALGSAATLTLDDALALADPANAPRVAAVAPILQLQGQIVYGAENVNSTVVGVTPTFAQVRNVKTVQGRFIDKSDLDSLNRVAVLGAIPTRKLFKGEDPIGKMIRVQTVPFRVIGVTAERGGGGPFGNTEDDQIYIPLTTAQSRLAALRAAGSGERLVSGINVSAVSEDQVSAAISDITATLRQRHRLAPGEQDDFSVISQKDLLGAFSQITSILTVFLGAIAAISLLVGGIGIMNIMLVSVTERTREIGLRKAIGARRRDILAQFLIEAITLSVLGGVVGILLGVGIARAVDTTGVIQTVVSAESVLLAVGFSVGVGLFFGIYPAARASRLNPIEALRYE
ncbi:MAG: ABC transporter permease [Anaerolineae bacterium]|nr:ABC transporter permease [Anaerolineae bacterium]